MKKLLYILLFTLSSQFCVAQDSVSYFNKTLPKNAVTGTLGGETFFFSIGYERFFFTKKKLRLNFSSKIGISPHYGAAIPTGIIMECFENKNKLIAGVFLCNNVIPSAINTNWSDVKKIENNTDWLKSPVRFVWAPYGVITIGYKRYINSKHAISIYLNGAIYPTFEMLPDENYKKCKLVAAYYAWGGITYHRQF